MMNEDAYAGNLVSDAIFGAINDLTTEGYERKIQEEQQARQEDVDWYEAELEKRSIAEADTLAMAQQSIEQQLKQKEALYKRLIGEEQGRTQEAQQSYEGLKAQMEREGLTAQEQRMALETEIRTLKESRDAEIQQGLAVKNAETSRLEESIRTLQRGNEDLQAQMKRLQDDIDFKNKQLEGAVTKKEADELRKETGRLGKELKYIREQEAKGNTTIKQQALELMKLRGEIEPLQQEKERYDEELLSAKEKIIRLENTQRGLVTSFTEAMEEQRKKELKGIREDALRYQGEMGALTADLIIQKQRNRELKQKLQDKDREVAIRENIGELRGASQAREILSPLLAIAESIPTETPKPRPNPVRQSKLRERQLQREEEQRKLEQEGGGGGGTQVQRGLSLDRIKEEMNFEKEYTSQQISHRSQYGFLSDPQYYSYVGLRQAGMPRQQALDEVQCAKQEKVVT